MADNTSNNKRIAKNTILLYVRMIVMMAISFYTTRVILNALGETDYGIHNVVGGLVSMFMLVSSSLSSSVSRFFTFALGKGDEKELSKTFATSINIHFILAIIVIIFIETLGVWFLNNKMNIPEGRMDAANWVLQLSALAFAINLIAVPFNAAIIAYEKMSAFAYMTIFDATARLAIAFATDYCNGDKLIVYSALCLIPPTTSLIIYWRYCTKKFKTCKYHYVWDNKMFKEIFAFAGWSFMGSLAGVAKNQGVNLIINIFHGPIVNAARGIAMQVNSVVTHFITNFTMALNPQITKGYASGDLTRMHKLVFVGARFSYYLFLTITIPLLFETNYVLTIWLKEVPDYTVVFTRLVLILTLCEIVSNTLITAQAATGKIRNYQLVVGFILLLNFPISYLLLYLGMPPESTLVAAIIISQICLLARLYFLRSMAQLPAMRFLKEVYLNVIIVTAISIIPPLLTSIIMQPSTSRFLTIGIVSVLSSLTCIYFIGCRKEERRICINILNKLKNKILH